VFLISVFALLFWHIGETKDKYGRSLTHQIFEKIKDTISNNRKRKTWSTCIRVYKKPQILDRVFIIMSFIS
jgi:hypothetical protein